jgi:hypothetical protein
LFDQAFDTLVEFSVLRVEIATQRACDERFKLIMMRAELFCEQRNQMLTFTADDVGV